MISTERLSIAEWTLDDLPRFEEIHRGVAEDGGRIERDPRATLRRYRLHGMGMWRVVRREGDRVVGQCGLQRLAGTLDVELGYLLAPDCRGRGYATEAARAVLVYGFETLELARIVALASPENAASIAVMERLGMTFDKRAVVKGREMVVYSLRPFRQRSTKAATRSK